MSSLSSGKQRVYIAGHTGLVGSALVRYFSEKAPVSLIVARHSELDLTCQKAVEDFLKHQKPDNVVVAAGRIGGIQANAKYPADFIYQNLMIVANLIHAAWKVGVKRLLNFGSSCIYPKESPQPMRIEHLMTGQLEPTNEPYAIAKLAGMSLCESYNRQYGTSYINVIPSNIYGPGDGYDLEKCHVISAVIRKLHEAKVDGAKMVTFWGSGNVTRDFLFVDDFAEACGRLLNIDEKRGPINVGAQAPCTVRELAGLVADIVQFKGKIRWDTSYPDGALERTLDATEIKKLGWAPKTNLRDGLEKTYHWFLEHRTSHIVHSTSTRSLSCTSL